MFTLTQAQLDKMKGMDLTATVAFLKAIIDPLIASGEITIEQFKDFAGKDAAAKQFIQQQADGRIETAIATGVDTWKEKHLDEEVEKAYLKKHPDESEADKTIRELKQRTLDLEEKGKKSDLENFAIKALQAAKLDLEWTGMVMNGAEDETAVGVNITSLQERLTLLLDVQKKAIYKKLGRTVHENEDETKVENNYGSNPWKEPKNLTLQGKIFRENPALAKILMKQAGVV